MKKEVKLCYIKILFSHKIYFLYSFIQYLCQAQIIMQVSRQFRKLGNFFETLLALQPKIGSEFSHYYFFFLVESDIYWVDVIFWGKILCEKWKGGKGWDTSYGNE